LFLSQRKERYTKKLIEKKEKKLFLCPSSGTHLENEQYWVINVEQLQFYAGFIAMQSTLGSSCNPYTA